MRYVHGENELLERPYVLAEDVFRRMKAGTTAEFHFEGKDLGYCLQDDNEYKLYFTGEVDLPPAYRCEPQYPVLYRRIGDSLEKAGDVFRLKVVSDDVRLPRAAFYKAADIPSDVRKLDFSCNVLADACKDARCRIEIEVFYKNGKARFAFDDDAEVKETLVLDESRLYTARIELEKEVDFVLVSLRFEHFTGSFTIDSPVLLDERGVNHIEPFRIEPRDLTAKKWLGLNLSKIERPFFEIELNGKIVFSGESFERIHRWPSHIFKLPKDCINEGRNVIRICYVGGYSDPPDYILRSVQLLISPTEQGIIACEKYARRRFGVLIKLKEETVVCCGASRAELRPLAERIALPAGLHVAQFTAQPFTGGASVFVTIGEKRYEAPIARYVEKEGKDVITGTGDSIYNRLDRKGMTDYLSWYLFNKIGNMFTFRTSYRWSGSDRAEEGIYDWAIDLLGDYGVDTAIMIDGRELPSAETNRKQYFGNNPHFLGYQAHERDGAFFYWGTGKHTPDEAFYYEILSKLYECEGIEPLRALVKRGDDYYKYYDDHRAKNMKEGCEYFLENITPIVRDVTRHSGPSVFFKYFFQAGVKWLCAELMYGCLETCVAALRGASLANGQKGYGGHMAVQWSTTPHDDIYRYRRYFNALVLGYTNGLTEINTEEGCYRLEEIYADFERNSSACRHHASVQSAFYDFIATHTRRGEIKTNIAVLHGKYDSFSLFNRTTVWGMEGSAWSYSEKSWDMLHVFFPHAKLDVVYRHNCPHEPVGFYTGTPYGLIDIVPDDAPVDFLTRYPYLMLFGYNAATHDFNERILRYVENGGTLLATLAHFMGTIDHATANAGAGELVIDDAFRALFGSAEIVRADFGQRLAYSCEEIQSGRFGKDPARLIQRKVGKGNIIVFNTTAYPDHASIRAAFREEVETLARHNALAERSRGWADAEGWVSTSVFDAEDRRTVYCVNVNWWSDTDQAESVTLYHGGYAYRLFCLRDCVTIASLFEDTAVVVQDMSTDVLSYRNGVFRVQGNAGSTFTVCRGGEMKTQTLQQNGVNEFVMDDVQSMCG